MQEATGVTLPTSLPISVPGLTNDEEAGASGGKGKGIICNESRPVENKEGEGGEEKKEEETDKLGRINFKLDYNFEKNTLAVTVIQVSIERQRRKQKYPTFAVRRITRYGHRRYKRSVCESVRVAR